MEENMPNEENVVELELTPEEFKRIMSHLFNATQETTNPIVDVEEEK
jgi:hypothetical protein